MKLIFAIIQNDDAKPLTRVLTKHHISVTRISSTGGFLSAGNSILMIGVDEARLQETLDLIKEHSHRRTAAMPAVLMTAAQNADNPLLPIDVTIGGATVFVVDVEQFEKY
jgi:uncharacterized protein YaaQ